MDSKTALSTEFLVIGAVGWLWLLPVASIYGDLEVPMMLAWLSASGPFFLGVATLLTFAVGVLTEALSFALEKLLVGPTSHPHTWYMKHVAKLSDSDWHAAQERIWSSQSAYQEFASTRMRVTVSRGVVTNAIIALVVVGVCRLSSLYRAEFTLFAGVAGLMALLGVVAWWFGTIEYAARVRVAGTMRESTVAKRILSRHDKEMP